MSRPRRLARRPAARVDACRALRRAAAAVGLLAAACGAPGRPSAAPPTAAPPAAAARDATADATGGAALATARSAAEWQALVPALAAREAAWRAALAAEPPILALPIDGDDAAAEARRRAQQIALADARVQAFARDAASGAALRTEVLQVRAALPADLTAADAACRGAPCQRVELYNHATNAALRALVDAGAGAVVRVEPVAATQPEVPPHLAALAIEIARRAPEVEALLGFAPGAGDAVMAGVKSALNGSRCERSRHLCVAPTFVVGDQALWAIVDLTDGRLVGTRWTDVGAPGVAVTEQSLADEVVMARFCQVSTVLERDGWSLRYRLTPSDGLEVLDATFDGRPVLRSAKLVDWHVSYSGTDGFGYSDAVGCPKFSTASVVAFGGPTVAELPAADGGGFALEQDFRSELWPAACNYRYAQRFAFYADGSFRIGGANLGRGCGNTGTYRPVLRIDLTAGGDGSRDAAAEWDGRAWRPLDVEAWRPPDGAAALTPDGRRFRFTGPDGGGYDLVPNRGQFGDGSRGDDAYAYLTVHRAEEGDGDLLTIGPCCNDDHRQGPESFMAPPEPIRGADLVLWIVPQLVNSDAPDAPYCWAEAVVTDGKAEARVFPCPFGPRFVPVAAP